LRLIGHGGTVGVDCDEVRSIRVLKSRNRVEHAAAYDRSLGFDSLLVAMEPT